MNHSFNSLSRDNNHGPQAPLPLLRLHFQLPLSGSQYNFTNHRLLDTDSNFQLPLSGSHTSLIMNLSPSGRTLSTPSLGITFALLAYPCDKHSFLLSTPSLGITGSRQLDILGLNAVSNCFQLPLSGSLKWEGERARVMYWTFNSLSRDHGRIPGTVKRVVGAPLSTPSLGITGSLTGGCSPSPSPCRGFQLPLSGSPSQIPGFFGSPRLYAAAPFRTNDF